MDSGEIMVPVVWFLKSLQYCIDPQPTFRPSSCAVSFMAPLARLADRVCRSHGQEKGHGAFCVIPEEPQPT